jgi:thiol-disulfide isomerase/thioredoxin
VTYDQYYEEIRQTRNPRRYWIDDATGVIRRVEFNELTTEGVRNWTVTIDKIVERPKPSSSPPMERHQSSLVGRAAPDFDLLTSKGTRIHLSNLRGNKVFLNFWATWCGPCIEEMGFGAARLHKFLQAQQENRPSQGTMREHFRVLVPIRVPEMENCLLVHSKDFELNFRINPVRCDFWRDMPAHELVRLQNCYSIAPAQNSPNQNSRRFPIADSARAPVVHQCASFFASVTASYTALGGGLDQNFVPDFTVCHENRISFDFVFTIARTPFPG